MNCLRSLVFAIFLLFFSNLVQATSLNNEQISSTEVYGVFYGNDALSSLGKINYDVQISSDSLEFASVEICAKIDPGSGLLFPVSLRSDNSCPGEWIREAECDEFRVFTAGFHHLSCEPRFRRYTPGQYAVKLSVSNLDFFDCVYSFFFFREQCQDVKYLVINITDALVSTKPWEGIIGVETHGVFEADSSTHTGKIIVTLATKSAFLEKFSVQFCTAQPGYNIVPANCLGPDSSWTGSWRSVALGTSCYPHDLPIIYDGGYKFICENIPFRRYQPGTYQASGLLRSPEGGCDTRTGGGYSGVISSILTECGDFEEFTIELV